MDSRVHPGKNGGKEMDGVPTPVRNRPKLSAIEPLPVRHKGWKAPDSVSPAKKKLLASAVQHAATIEKRLHNDVNDRQAVPVYRNSMQMGTNSGQNRHHQLQAQEVSPEDMEDTVAKVVEMEVRRVEQSWMTRLREEIKEDMRKSVMPQVQDEKDASPRPPKKRQSELEDEEEKYYKFRPLTGGYGYFADRLMYIYINPKMWPLAIVTAPFPAVVSFLAQIIFIARLWTSMDSIFSEDDKTFLSPMCSADALLQIISITIYLCVIMEQLPNTIKNATCILFARHRRSSAKGLVKDYELDWTRRLIIFTLTSIPDIGTTITILIVGVKHILMSQDVASIVRASINLTFIIRVDEMVVKLLDAWTHKVRIPEYECFPVFEDTEEKDMPPWFFMVEILSAIFALPVIVASACSIVLILRASPYINCAVGTEIFYLWRDREVDVW